VGAHAPDQHHRVLVDALVPVDARHVHTWRRLERRGQTVRPAGNVAVQERHLDLRLGMHERAQVVEASLLVELHAELDESEGIRVRRWRRLDDGTLPPPGAGRGRMLTVDGRVGDDRRTTRQPPTNPGLRDDV
jgi:hypothetical protein